MEWLSLAEYSMKHKVSISTLRRRIKAEDIQFKLEDGKYLILDSQENLVRSETVEDQFETFQSGFNPGPSPGNSSSAVSVTYNLESPEQFRVENIVRSYEQRNDKFAAHKAESKKPMTPPPATQVRTTPTVFPPAPSSPPPGLNHNEAGESVLTAANRLLTDLKKAYTQVLQEKEQVISDLREENSDLKTLIKVLESENDRLREYRV